MKPATKRHHIQTAIMVAPSAAFVVILTILASAMASPTQRLVTLGLALTVIAVVAVGRSQTPSRPRQPPLEQPMGLFLEGTTVAWRKDYAAYVQELERWLKLRTARVGATLLAGTMLTIVAFELGWAELLFA